MTTGKLTDVLTRLFDEAGKRKDRTCERTLSGATVIRAVRDEKDPNLFTFIAANYGAGVQRNEWNVFLRFLSMTESYRREEGAEAEPFTEERSVNTLTGFSILVRKRTPTELLQLEQKRQEQQAAEKAAADAQPGLFGSPDHDDIPF